MAADPLSPIAPARVRVLVVPAGRIKRDRFMTFVERLQQQSIVRLGDISPDAHPDRTMFSPMAFPNGALLYYFSTAMPPPSNLALTPYELFREPVMVVGIADAKEYHVQFGGEEEGQRREEETLSKQELDNVTERLREQYPRFLVHQLLIMDCLAEHGSDWTPDRAMCVPAQKTTKSTSMRTVMCDLSAKFLSELTTYAKAVQALPSVQSPGISAAVANITRRPTIERLDSKSQAPFPLSRASSTMTANLTPETRPESPTVKPPTSFDEIANAAMAGNPLPQFVRGPEKEVPRTASRDRMSMQAFGSSNTAEKTRNKGKARVGIVIGNLYMMAGRWSDAWRELVENTNKSRIASDYLWYAKGLESILVCMLLFVWTGYDFHIPAICYPAPDRPLSLISAHSIKDGLPSLGAQEPIAAQEAAQRLAKLLPDLIQTIFGIHEKATNTGGELLPPVAYSEGIIRMAKLLALLHDSNGQLDSRLVGNMMSGKKSTSHPNPNAGYIAAITKHTIAEMLFRAYPPPNADLTLNDETKILAGIASVFSMLGLERKKAIVTKELIASLVPALVQARKVGAAEMGIHPAASLSSAFDIPTSDQQSGLDGLLKEIHAVYGATTYSTPNLASTDSSSTSSKDTVRVLDVESLVDATVSAATNFADQQAFGSLNLKIDILRACIDFCEALPDLPGIVHFAALLLRIAGPQSAIAPTVNRGRVRLATEEQIRMISHMSRTSNAANKMGLQEIQVPYWDDFLVRNVQWSDSELTEKLREHREPRTHGESNPQKKTTPFLYDPFAKQDKKAEERVLVAGENAETIVTLQNPYDFDIRIERLSFQTEGVPLQTSHAPFNLGPARIENFVVAVRAKDVGQLTIVGCRIKIVGCVEQLFPIYPESWSVDVPMKIKALGLKSTTKETLPAEPDSNQSQQIVRPVPSILTSTVIQAQPHVVVDGTSLVEAALMVLEGQRKIFQVSLHNRSSTRSVDFLHFSFEDSLTTSIRAALDNKELTRAEMYELEVRLTEDPVFTWRRSDPDSSQLIAPGEKVTYDITVVGRPGLGAAKIMFDYAYLGQRISELQGHAYTRQVTVPIDITVNASIQLHRIDFAEFPSEFAWSNQHRQRIENKDHRPLSRRSSRPPEKSNDRFRTLLDRVGLDSNHEEHCLVMLDLRNAWPNPLTVSVEVREGLGSANSSVTSSPVSAQRRGSMFQPWKRAYTVHEVVHPGHIARLVLLLPKIQVEHPHAPIPLLSAKYRQFVVKADRVYSHDNEMATREQFWFREEALKCIRGSWKEDGTARQGAIDLRGLRLSTRMIDVMRLQDIDCSMAVLAAGPLKSDDDSPTKASITQLGRSSFQVSTQSFLTLRTTVTNRTATPIRGILRLQPSLAHQTVPDLALDVGRKFMVSGLLQQTLPEIPAKQSVTIELGVCPLVSGEFDVHALVEELTIPESDMEDVGDVIDSDQTDEDFSVGGQGLRPRERRLWRAGEICRLVVADVEE